MSDVPKIRYLNTDLDLICGSDLTPLADALNAKGVFPLDVSQFEDGLWYSRHEVSEDVEPDEPESTIRVLLDAIEAIDGKARQLWDACGTRELNIGFDCGDEPWVFNAGLTSVTLQRMAAVGTSLRITLYPNRPDSKDL
jgi:hypothetical protein